MAGLFGRFFNYEKAGSGIAKDAPKKKRIVVFFEIYFRKFWSLLWLNFIYLLFCIPIITIGPATAGVTKVLRNYSQERHAFLWGDFWESFRKNFKQSFPVGIVDVILFSGIGLGLYVYPKLAQATGQQAIYLLMVLSLSLGIVCIIMNFYIFLMIVATDLSLKNIIKNSFYLTCIALKKNMLTFLIAMGITALFTALPMFVHILFLAVLPFMPATLIGLMICFNCYPVVQKYVIDPYYEQRGEENPEYAYYKAPEGEEAIFTDMGGKEAPVNPTKQSGGAKTNKGLNNKKPKGKIIS